VKSSDKNLYFSAILFFLLLVLGGLKLVDASLTRLIEPEAPFATFSVQYEHGLVLKGPKNQYRLPSLKLVTIRVEESSLHLSRGGKGLKLPRFLTWGNIEKLRGLLDVDKLMP
jgi:hypothetical protein